MSGTFKRQHVVRLEARRRGLERDERRQQHPGAGEEHERRGDLRHGKETQPAIGSRRHAARCRSRGRCRSTPSAAGSRGTNARTTAAASARLDADPQQARVDGQVERAHREAGRIPRENGHHRPRDGDAEHGARTAQQQALGEERAPQRAGARAERRADGQLALAPHRSREDQVRDIRARDDEDQRRRREQHEQHGPRRRHDLIAQADGIDPEVGRRRVGLGMLLDDRAVDRPQLGARRLELDAGRQARRRARSSGARAHPASSPRDGAGWSRCWR